MASFRLKELKDTKKHEDNIRRYVKANMYKSQKKNRLIPILTILVSVAVLFFIVNIASPSKIVNRSSSEQLLYNVFEKTRGEGVAYSEFFKPFDQQDLRQLTYYKPVSLSEFLRANGLSLSQLPKPFHANDGEVIAVQDAMHTELQLHFKSGETFLNISMAKDFMNPLFHEELQNVESDTVGNKITMLELADEIPLFLLTRTTDSALVYRYYGYDKERNRIHLIATAADEFYTYYNGIIYHIGYSGAVNEEEMIAFVKDFILHNTIQQLDFMKKYEKKWGSSLQAKLIAVSTFVLIFIAALYYIVRRKSKKIKVMTFGISSLFIITPLVSWVIAMTVASYEGDGFAGVAMLMLTLPIGWVLSLALIIYGVVLFVKDKKKI
ncbi:hypothetical protein [Bacillus ndiopicus]|uniref:hypothetical protein n=1 Tax=Bacillus ndiopicus TaxID=1347368 RepID=UPI0005A84A77|nr:hypothetical protein [Bacillus ndiopicus]